MLWSVLNEFVTVFGFGKVQKQLKLSPLYIFVLEIVCYNCICVMNLNELIIDGFKKHKDDSLGNQKVMILIIRLKCMQSSRILE